MRCPRCGNDIQLQESFCGQCGLPVRPSTTGSMRRLPTSSWPGVSSSQPSSSYRALTSTGKSQVPPSDAVTYSGQSGAIPRVPRTEQSGVQYYPGNTGNISQVNYTSPTSRAGQSGSIPPVPRTEQPGSRSYPGYSHGQQQSGLYGRNPSAQARSQVSYGQQSGMRYEITDSVRMQSMAGYARANTNTYAAQAAQMQNSRSMPSQPPVMPSSAPAISRVKNRSSISSGSSILVVCICLFIILIGIVGGRIFLTSHSTPPAQPANNHSGHADQKSNAAALKAVQGTATPALSVPTPVPDAGFVTCGAECAPQGFMDEYPLGWQRTVLLGGNGTQIVNIMQPDEIAIYKVQNNPGATSDVLLAGELQSVYAGQPGYQAVTATHQMTIGGENWISANISYQGSGQQVEHVATYVTIHHGKCYIVEFQAPQNQFAQTAASYFNPMLVKFRFT